VEVDRGLVGFEPAVVPVAENISADIVSNAVEAKEEGLTKSLEVEWWPDMFGIPYHSKRICSSNIQTKRNLSFSISNKVRIGLPERAVGLKSML
jgi:hypothetical protein